MTAASMEIVSKRTTTTMMMMAFGIALAITDGRERTVSRRQNKTAMTNSTTMEVTIR